MAMRCQNCGRGVGYGNAVSHAKNRVKRLFKPNLQKLKVLKDGEIRRVKLCTNCIQRLKKDRQFGPFRLISYIKEDREIKEAMAKAAKIEVPVAAVKEDAAKKKAEAMKIEDIVGKK